MAKKASDREYCTDQELIFVNNYEGGDPSAAAKIAGFGPTDSGAQHAGYRLLQRQCVLEALKIKQAAMTTAIAMIQAQKGIMPVVDAFEEVGVTAKFLAEKMKAVLELDMKGRNGARDHVAALRLAHELRGDLGSKALEAIKAKMTEDIDAETGKVARMFDVQIYRAANNLNGDSARSS